MSPTNRSKKIKHQEFVLPKTKSNRDFSLFQFWWEKRHYTNYFCETWLDMLCRAIQSWILRWPLLRTSKRTNLQICRPHHVGSSGLFILNIRKKCPSEQKKWHWRQADSQTGRYPACIILAICWVSPHRMPNVSLEPDIRTIMASSCIQVLSPDVTC